VNGRIILMLVVAALLVVAVTLSAAPAFAWVSPPSPSHSKCNAGNGNGNEFCDPGNSAPQNKGGDEIGCPTFLGGSTPNPGGNNRECT
jgi:hypothetical protein